MKTRTKIALIVLIMILAIMSFTTVYANAEDKRELGANELRPFTNLKYQFRSGSEGQDLVYTIFKIYDNKDRNAANELLYSKALYCLRGGVGFGASESTDVSSDPIEYTEIGEMHENASEVITKYEEYYGINLDRTETIDDKEVNIYNAILWILDEAYLPVDKTNEEGEIVYSEAEYKEELLTKVGIPKLQQEAITKDDLEVIQQLAIWYFANYDEQKSGNLQSVSVATKFPAQFLSINGSNNIDNTRAENLNKIYQYFIYNASDNSFRYQGTDERNKYVGKNEFDKDVDLQIKSVDYEETIPDIYHPELYYYEIGPFKVKNNIDEGTARDTLDLSNIILYDADENPVKRFYEMQIEDEETGEITSGGLQEVYYFVNSEGERVTEIEKGMEYYIRFKKLFEKGFKLGNQETSIPEDEKYDMSSVTLEISSSYSLSTATFLVREDADQPVVEIEKEKMFESDKITTEAPKEFDLSLRKFITSIKRGETNIEVESRVPQINTNTLINGIDNREGTKEYTATYTHSKNALSVETGDKVVYAIRIYNEGELDGTATEITDHLPEGLELVPASESTINTTYRWTASSDGKTITTDYLKDTTIKAFNPEKTSAEGNELWQKADEGESGLSYADVQVECRVVAEVKSEDQSLRNIAEITADTGDDRDSTPENVDTSDYNPPVDNSTYQEDDDDYEDLKLPAKAFDLALRKFITSIKRNGEEVEFDDRTPSINTETLINGTFDRNGELEYTATYEHSKEPLTVKKGDIITYTLRIYNEGDIDGYATEITDYIPEGLAYINYYNANMDNLWELDENFDFSQVINLVGEDGFYETEEDVKNLSIDDFSGITSLNEVQLITGEVKITTNRLDDELLKAFDKNKTEEEEGWQKADNGDGGLYYKDIQVACLVVAENTYKDTITNIAEISEDKDENGNDIIDRDSTPDNKQDPYDKQQEDDDDYEPVVLKYFDLALRKFITGVETNGKTEDITSRIPVPTMGEDGNIVYEHSKDPVYVANNDTVIYTIRVYNEGTIAGYAEEIKDDIPEGLEYLPDHDINKQYEWIMVDENGDITENVEEATEITTDYLSSEKETEERDNLIDPFDSSKPISTENPLNPDYKEVKVAFRVTEPNTSDRIIINSAQISEDSDDDEDSVPDEWNDGEDDQDKEYIYVKYFDLSLLKWVTKTIVTVDGKTTTTETGFKPNTGKTETTGIRDNDESEPIAKVELDRNKLSSTTVKFVYKIRVTNEGEIEGYATEITDFIPEGLEFKEEDNKAYGWVKEGDNKVTTRALETKLLKPGESAEVEIVFTWKNDTNNLGLKTNIAEITEDYNEHNSEDIDSTPDNKKDPYESEQEDDDDFALVILSIKTGKGASYVLFTTAMLILLTTGIYLVKRYVLTY